MLNHLCAPLVYPEQGQRFTTVDFGGLCSRKKIKFTLSHRDETSFSRRAERAPEVHGGEPQKQIRTIPKSSTCATAPGYPAPG